MSMHDSGFPKILGTATLNEKGQLVIPAEARLKMNLSPGSKLVIMSSPHRPALIIVKAEAVEAIVKDLANALHDDEPSQLTDPEQN